MPSVFRGLEEYHSSSIRQVEDTNEARFSMDVMADEDFNSNASMKSLGASKRVKREYDGRFPHLTVSFESVDGTIIDPVQDLPVVKVGKTLRRLRIRQANSDAKETSAAQYVVVLWSVDLENNRRVLTISSAVSIGLAGCGVSIEVGVKQYLGLHTIALALDV